MPVPKTPLVAVDIIVEIDRKVLLIERAHEPHGWALPGGFVDIGESPAAAAVREAKEETSLDVELTAQLHCYGAPGRDPRGHTVSIVYCARAIGGAVAKAADDARNLQFFPWDALPKLAFDHDVVLADYRHFMATGERPGPKR
jgi:8-oxo-dGTP diphosphatase